MAVADRRLSSGARGVHHLRLEVSFSSSRTSAIRRRQPSRAPPAASEGIQSGPSSVSQFTHRLGPGPDRDSISDNCERVLTLMCEKTIFSPIPTKKPQCTNA
ncbi:Hypothetical protein NTJ_01762 [Nesidiocoris tenuis]|uniref:Uncharacterized protein n=1 Tax=Nesidiocoris tenuis TaxID=355587 RepID=A0ABN7AF97_9HEMI|nr:Hypothetical protein NTJ_01762 [Nesidiocoris tenuis]